MYARVAMYEEVDVENWDRVANWFEEHGDAMNQRLTGYMGSMTLVDRANARLYGIGLYDTEAHAQAVDAIMDQGAPSEMPEDLVAILQRASRRHRGVYDVVQADGRLNGA